MTSPMFSILSPVYNEEANIREMIESLLRQSFTDWQVVFVDDGSTDETAAIINEYGARDRRIVLGGDGVRMGKVAAINRAFAVSSGIILFHLAGDDFLDPGSLETRAAAFRRDVGDIVERKQTAFFKMRTTSDNVKFDDLVLPKGTAVSRTGASPTYTRDLAETIFPIPEHLPSEDLWIGFLAEELADLVNEVDEIGWRYRIHDGNSNPRHKSFGTMSSSIASRAAVWSELLESDRFMLSSKARQELATRWELELLRREGRVLSILCSTKARLIDRLAVCAAAHPTLFRIRMRFYRQLTGLRGA